MIKSFFNDLILFLKITVLLRYLITFNTVTGNLHKDNFKKLNVDSAQFLTTAKNNEITFFHSKKYEYLASKTKALFCITTENLSKILPNNCNKIIVDNVLISTAMVTKTFYPNSVTDDFDFNVKEISWKLL